MIDSLGFTGRQNHYVGALWFYELVDAGNVYATGTVTFTGTPAFSSTVTVVIGRRASLDADETGSRRHDR